jgi:uncharacterized protein (DUF983 family)
MASSGVGERLRRGLARALRLRCPRCGRTPLFTGRFAMHAGCAACGLAYERAQGYWVGAVYVSYAVTATTAIGGAFLAWVAFGIDMRWQLAFWLPFVVLFPLWFFRYSRAIWLAVETELNPEP